MQFFSSAFFRFTYLALFILGALSSSSARSETTTLQVNEEYQSYWDHSLNLDSLAVWHGPNNDHRVLATSKGKHKIVQFNATTGIKIGEYGKQGTSNGDLNYPNGIAVSGDYVFIVERDNHRVQVFSLPSWSSLGSFGSQQLGKPYGLTIIPQSSSEFMIYVTDNYLLANKVIPPMSELGARVKQYQVKMSSGTMQAQLIRAFGETQGNGVLYEVESILSDPERGILYIADEMKKDIKIYNMDGTFADQILGRGFFPGEPEGIALYQCPDGSGYVILTDQSETSPELNQFHVFDRRTHSFIGSFFGPNTSNTDGISLTQFSFSGFNNGVLYSLNNDGGISAFDWQDIASTLGLKTSCVFSSK